MSLTIILFYRKIGRYALNAIAGAIDVHPVAKNFPMVLATTTKELLAALDAAASSGNKALVCWSFYSLGFKENARLLSEVRRANHDDALHIAGGVHASAEPEQTLRAGWDIVALDEGEQTIGDLAQRVAQEEDWHHIQGLAWCENGQMKKSGRGTLIDLDEYPAFPLRFERFGPLEITRGCVFACSFCQTPFVSKARFRHRSIESICRHFERMVTRNLRDYRFITPTAMSYGSQDERPNYEAVEELLARVRETVGADRNVYFGTFPSEIRPEHITPHAIQIIKQYCDNDNVIVGGQSGSDKILQSIHRGHTVEDVRRAVALILEAGLTPNVDFLFGLPGEENEDIEMTRRLAEELADKGARIHSHTFLPLPGTPLRSSSAGVVDEETGETLKLLESQGKAYGQWKAQMEMAKELEGMRNA